MAYHDLTAALASFAAVQQREPANVPSPLRPISKVGDLVRLKKGGPVMQIVAIRYPSIVCSIELEIGSLEWTGPFERVAPAGAVTEEGKAVPALGPMIAR